MKPLAGLLLALPLAGFLLEALLGAGGFRLPLRAWIHTAVLGGGATLVALLFGLPAGLVLAGTTRTWPRALTLLPPLLPPVLAAAAWSGAGLPSPGLFGCAFLLGCLYWPVVAFAFEASLRRLPGAALEAATLQLPSGLVWRRVVWPHARPAIVAAALLVFALAASEFTLPATFVLQAIPMLVYEEMSAFRYAAAAGAALPLLALAAGLAFRLRRLPALPAVGAAGPLPRSRTSWIFAVAAWMLTVLAPLAIFARGFRPGTTLPLESLAWSAGVAASVAVLLVAWSWLTPGRSKLEPLWLALLILPGVVAGFGLLAPAGRLGIVAPAGSLLLWAFAARFAFVAWLPLREPVEPAQLEAAALAGLGRARTWWRIVRPASAPRAFAAGLLVFVLCLGELGPAVLLAPPGRQPLVQHVFTWMHYGYDEAVASACLLTAATVAAGAWIVAYAGRKSASRVAA